MEISAKGGQAKPETGNAASFNWWFFTLSTQGQQLKQEMNNKKL